jgi:hypothetical protein
MRVPSAACVAGSARPHPGLRRYVLGYGGFRAGGGRPLAHRLLPLGFVTLVIDPDVGPLVTGARERATVDGCRSGAPASRSPSRRPVCRRCWPAWR